MKILVVPATDQAPAVPVADSLVENETGVSYKVSKVLDTETCEYQREMYAGPRQDR